jgi:hypothetical protein
LSETIEQAAEAAASGAKQEQPEKREFKACPCGVVPEQLLLEVPQQGKVGRATCGTCGVWGMDFLRGHTQDPEAILDKAHAAWDSAPRASAVTPDS